MFDKIIRYVCKQAQWWRYARQLDNLRTLDELQRFFDTHDLTPPYVTDKPEVSEKKRTATNLLLDEYQLDVAGKRVLDIGPGYGDFLDVVRARGGTTVGLDHDPFVVRWLQLRGHITFRGNILRSTRCLQGQLFELINSTGSIIVEYFGLVGYGQLRKFLNRLERLRAPDGAILVCPFFEVTGPQRKRKIEDPRNCTFTEVMQAEGYRIMPSLPGVHDGDMYCVTYGKLP